MPIYLDHHATTPCDPRVVEAMMPWFSRWFANPGSTLSAEGRRAQSALDRARAQVAELINAEPNEVIFCGSATESINLALQGIARATRRAESSARRRTLVTSATEHKAVLETLRALALEGFEAVVVPVLPSGRLDETAFQQALAREPLLVSIQAANNETGVLQDIPHLAALAQEAGAIMHCDASQWIGKLPCDVLEWEVDLLSFSAHKLYGPKGIGALYLQGGPSRWQLQPLVYGGGQERGLRSGTQNVPAVVGFGVACELASSLLHEESNRMEALRDRLESLLLQRVPGLKINGLTAPRLPGSSSLTFPGVDSEALILRCAELAISNGSACSSGAPEPSYVLLAMGLSREAAWQTIRIGLGRGNTAVELERVVEVLTREVSGIRQQEGS